MKLKILLSSLFFMSLNAQANYNFETVTFSLKSAGTSYTWPDGIVYYKINENHFNKNQININWMVKLF
jgi:hypothetical protein